MENGDGQWRMEKDLLQLLPGLGVQGYCPMGLGSRTDGGDGVNQGTRKDVE